MTDLLWVEQILIPCDEKYREEKERDMHKYRWAVKADWYDLDFLYLSKSPDFRAFQIYKNAVGFQNTYMDIFAEDAFDNRREYIVGFYSGKRENLKREYPYLSEGRMNQFVEEAGKKIAEWVREFQKEKMIYE